ncbi:MAG: efflux RND transporter periplasmic adaptor subunit [Proteobacteria bacterium]|nr:efflux RND transporter periplasmic adaptor subunit [Pseudomonadota bacterium]NOG60924.1 efflux RND transporter periplasmic adaptor subunit [Pseudomonadota bacterium]
MRHKLTYLFLLYFVLLSPLVNAGGVPPTMVQVDDAINIEIAPFIWVSGTVIGRFDSKISAEVTGVLENVLDVGDRVEKSEVIAKIEGLKYQLALNEINAEVKPIETMVEFYRKEAERLEKLAKQNNAARNQLDQTQANHDEAQAKIRIVRARLAMAQDELKKTIVKAPFSGVITERYKAIGERVEAGDEIVRLINTDKIEIQARIPQESFQHIQAGDSLSIKGPSAEIEGTVRASIPVGDDLSRLYEIRVDFDKEEWGAGTAVQIASPVNKKQNVIAVPRDALVIRQSGVVIYRINGENKSEVVSVKTGIANTTHIQVIGDVSENDKIVVRGNERLRPGQTVEIMGIN